MTGFYCRSCGALVFTVDGEDKWHGENTYSNVAIYCSKHRGLTSVETGRMGGLKCRDMYGVEFYEEIGAKGRAKMKRIIEAGKKALGE